MYMACEMGFWDMVDALPPEAREKFLREQAAELNEPFACDVPEEAGPAVVASPGQDERKP